MATYSNNVTIKAGGAVILSGGLNSGPSIGQYANQILCTAPANGFLKVKIWKIQVPNYSDQMALEIYGPGGTVKVLTFPDNNVGTQYEVEFLKSNLTSYRTPELIVPAGHSLRWQARLASNISFVPGNVQGSGQEFVNTPN